MPRLTGNRLPKYRTHASGHAVVTLDATGIYFDRVIPFFFGRCDQNN